MAAAAKIKTEPGTEEEVKQRIMALFDEHPAGINDQIMKSASSDASQCVNALNALLRAGRIQVFKKKVQGREELVYRRREEAAASSAGRGGDMEEKVVYQVIENAGNKGIWMRDIRQKTNMSIAQLNKLVKVMESKKLVKAVQCVSAAKKKVYMLYELEPDNSVTGGAWYNGNTFDHDFAEILNQRCFQYLKMMAATAKERFSDDQPLAQFNAGLVSAEDVHQHIQEIRLCHVAVSVKDIGAVLQLLVYDGKAKEVAVAGRAGASSSQGKMYRVAHPMIQTTGLMKVPCGHCPLLNECRENAIVSPKTCGYVKEWMEKLDF